MAGSLGELVVSLTAETAQFNDALSKAAYTAQQSLGSIATNTAAAGAAFQSLASAATSIGQALASIGVVVGIEQLVTSSIEASENMGRLALAAGTTAANLSQLVAPAVLSGTSIDNVAASTDRFSKQMLAAVEGSPKVVQALQTIGFSASDAAKFLQDPVAGLQQVANALSAFSDDGTKAAVIMTLFGRSAQDMIPFLNQLATTGLGVVTTTNAQAASAKELTDAWRTQTLAGQQLTSDVVSAITPAMTDLVRGFTQATTGAGGIRQAIQDLVSSGQITQWAQDAAAGLAHLADAVKDEINVLGNMGKTVGIITVGILDFALASYGASQMSTNFVGGMANMEKAVADFKTSFAAYQASLADETPTTKFSTALSDTALNAAMASFRLQEHAQAHTALTPVVKASADAAQNFVDKLILEDIELGLDKQQLLEFQAALAGAGDKAQVYIDSIIETTARIADQKIQEQQLEQALKDTDTATQQITDTETKETTVITNLIAKWNEEAEALAVSSKNHADLVAIMNALGQATDLTADDVAKLTAQLQAAAANKEAAQALVDQAKQVQEAWQKTATAIEDALVTAFNDVINKTGTLLQDLKNLALHLFDDLVLKPLIVSIVASMTGTSAAGALGSVATSNAGGLLSGGGGLGNIFGSLAGVVQPGAAGALGDVSTGSGLLGALGPDVGAAIGGITPFLPYVGLAIAGVALISSLFSSSGHGPKSGGYSEAGTAAGDFNSLYGGTGTTRAFTPSNDDATVATAVQSTLSQYNAFVQSLGGSGTASFALGYDTDPKGTAGNRISGGAIVNGQQVLSTKDWGVGTDQATLTADLALESQRSLLAALQASDFPKAVAAILNTVVASTATQDQITKVLSYAQGLGTINALLASDPTKAAATALAASTSTATSAFTAAGVAQQALINSYDGSAAATDALTASTQTYYQALVAVIAQSQAAAAAIDTTFQATIRSMTLSTLSTAGKGAYYDADIAKMEGLIATATDPALVEQYAKQIDTDVNAKFGLLTPAQQAAQLPAYTTFENQIDATASAQLKKISDAATAQFNTQATSAATLITSAATALGTAAATQLAAANTQLTAAQTPTTVNVNVDVSNPGAVAVNTG